MIVAVHLFVVLLALIGVRQSDAGTIKFTFGLTRPVDACEEVGDVIRYRSAGVWYHITRSDVQDITGLTCTKADGAAAPAPASAAASSSSQAARDDSASTDPALTQSGDAPPPGSSVSSGASSPGKDVHVKGYYQKDGTYVRPHTRSAPGSGGGRKK